MLDRSLSPGVRLRLFEEADAPALHALIVAEREALSHWMPWAPGQTEALTLAFIRRTRQKLADNQGLETVIVVDGRLAGSVGVHGIDWANGATSLGYWLASWAQGRGIMTAAVRLYVEHAFTAWDLERVELKADPVNTASRAVAVRAGFVEEGMRHSEETVPHDLVVYAAERPTWTKGA